MGLVLIILWLHIDLSEQPSCSETEFGEEDKPIQGKTL